MPSINFSSWITSLFTNLINKIKNDICKYLVKHPDRAAILIQKINGTLQKTNETQYIFVLTLNYINSPANQAELIYNSSTCLTFFDGFVEAVQTDVKNTNLTLADVENVASKTLNNLLNNIQELFPEM